MKEILGGLDFIIDFMKQGYENGWHWYAIAILILLFCYGMIKRGIYWF